MNERSQELIVDLLDGRLSPAEERTALLRIENDPDLHAEYEAQVSAMSVLGASSMPSMTSEERSALHATLRQQLHLDDAAVPVVASSARWQRWWAPLGGLAVAAAVVFGAVVILPGALSGSDSDESLDIAFADATTTVAAASRAGGIAGEDETVDTQAAAPEVAESRLEGEGAANEETRSTTTAAASDTAELLTALPYLPDVDLDALQIELASDPESPKNGISPPSAAFSELDASGANNCLDSLSAGDSAASFKLVATTTYEGTEGLVIFVSPAEGDSFLAVFSLDSCRELARTQG